MDHEGQSGRAEGQAAIGIRILLALAAALVAASAAGQDEHARRLGAELVVMAGDARRLTAAPPHGQEGLRRRLAGALSSLPVLLRQAGGDATVVAGLRELLARGDWNALAGALAALRRRHRLDLRGILPAPPTPQRLRRGEAIHRQACAACHDAPQADAALPASNLFEMARGMPAEEFAARLLNGVRGDASTALANPFGALDLSALLAWYSRGR
ncbi:MAG: hypothetical protein OHK0026_03520 [Rhodocyclaceae bacterium]